MTGMRETVLLNQKLSDGSVELDTDTGQLSGDWNPDDAWYDEQFPGHPISRVRHAFGMFIPGLRLDPSLARFTIFPLPQPDPSEVQGT